MIRHVLITAALAAVMLTTIGVYQAYVSSQPVLMDQRGTVHLDPVQTEFMERVATVAPLLARTPLETIDAVVRLCPTIRSGAQEAYKPLLINALTTKRYTLDRASADIIAAKARETICK